MKKLISALSYMLVGLCVAQAGKPLQIYILAGQSNMQGHAHVRTIEHVGMDPATKPMMDEMLNGDGTPKVFDQIWISSIGCADSEQTGKLTTGFGASQGGPKFGPELTFGIYTRKFTDAPILLIKTSWGGKSLNTDFRPPSAGPYVFNDQQLAGFEKQGKDLAIVKIEKEKQTGVYYRLMIEHVKAVLADIKRVVPSYDAADGFELAGFAWFQGWNDMVDSGTYSNRDKPGGYDAYSGLLAHFIRDVRKDLGVPKLPFVIGVLGVGGPTAEYGPFSASHGSTSGIAGIPGQCGCGLDRKILGPGANPGEGKRFPHPQGGEQAGFRRETHSSHGKSRVGETENGGAQRAGTRYSGKGHFQPGVSLSGLRKNHRRNRKRPG
jgi:hypothetical protein